MSQHPILSVEHIEVLYEQAILAVQDVSLQVGEGAVVALLGSNGAGKSTTLKAIAGLVGVERGEVSRGTIYYRNRDIAKTPASTLVSEGLVQVLEGRHCFPHLTVEENLRTGAFVRRPSRTQLKQDLERIYTWFPRLKVRRHSQTGYTSGGEQQMVAIGRALMSNPWLVLLDEPSMGLAPQIVEEIFDILHSLNRKEGVSFLVAEQNANIALRYADYAYILETGRVALEGPATELAARDDVQSFYLGLDGAQRISFRDARSYRRSAGHAA